MEELQGQVEEEKEKIEEVNCLKPLKEFRETKFSKFEARRVAKTQVSSIKVVCDSITLALNDD
jgi:hypothetical protein